ncbi:MAG: AMP-binding protein [Rhodobacteraceae bacterium]|nr:AMP-binding protein [Paracoccaceae bacterium]
MSYKEIYASWKSDPETFWMELAEGVDWDRKPSRALFRESEHYCNWYSDGLTNTCWNAVDRHVAAGRGDQLALIHDSPVTDSVTRVTYGELHDRVARLAGALQRQGVGVGDRVIIYMPMIPEAVMAMLACARIGAIHSVVFGGFAANELAVRIDDARPKCVLSASCGIEPGRIVEYKPLLDEAIETASCKPQFTVVLQREMSKGQMTEGRDLDWNEFVNAGQPCDCVPVAGDHPAYILYTSGTTGQPKGVIRPTAGHMVVLHWTMKNFFDMDPGEVFWAASDVGWVVGHSYICYAPLLHGNTSIVYEGKPVGTPDAAAFWRVISDHDVKALFTAPTAFRAIKRVDPDAKLLARHDISCLRILFLAGERADPDTIQWAEHHLGIPVVDHWWQTETGWPIAGLLMGVEAAKVKYGSCGMAMPGYDIRVLDEAGHEVERGELGTIAIKLPLPPGNLPTLWNADSRFVSSYLEEFPGFYNTGDSGYVDEDGYVFVMARTDDVINVAGHRLSTGLLEEVVASHRDVAECAVIGVHDDLKGQLPVGFICLNAVEGLDSGEVVAECVQLVRKQVGPVAAFRQAVVVPRLPKTRSGKVLRSTMARIADGEEFKMPATIDDPSTLDSIATALRTIGYAQQ